MVWRSELLALVLSVEETEGGRDTLTLLEELLERVSEPEVDCVAAAVGEIVAHLEAAGAAEGRLPPEKGGDRACS